MIEHEPPESRTLGQEVREDIVREAGVWLRWAVVGAIVGAVLVGGVGFWVFGFPGLVWGAGIGAALGGVGSWLFYLHATTL